MEIFNWLLLALRLPAVKVASTKIHAAVTYLQITFGNMPELLKMSPPPHNLQTFYPNPLLIDCIAAKKSVLHHV